jgi:hypothetical protein
MYEIDEDSFWARVDRSGESDACWLWMAGKQGDGYGCVRVKRNGRSTTALAHRISMQLHLGYELPTKLGVLHKPLVCTARACVNPQHLYLGTQKQNALDMQVAGTDPRINKTSCPKGHAYDYVWIQSTGRPRRCCRECNRVAAKEYQRRVRVTKERLSKETK